MTTIESLFDRYGEQIRFSGEDGWESPIFGAFVQPLKINQRLDGITVNFKLSEYIILCPPKHNINALDKNTFFVRSRNRKYRILQTDCVYQDGKMVYSWGIVTPMDSKKE